MTAHRRSAVASRLRLCAAACCGLAAVGWASWAAGANLGAYQAGMFARAHTPHPAVARIIVPEGDATSFGSGTLVDVRDQFGLVITNWHVVRDGQGDVEVLFPDGFRSKARPLKVDADWDLAALVIWRPPAPPVTIAKRAPQPGDRLTICGYGQGEYRAATGRCTKYYAPKTHLPQQMVELDVEARQGDSGGPIFNDQGELAGVLFGAGGGTTMGSFGGRVESFLATLAPDIGRRGEASVAVAAAPAPAGDFGAALAAVQESGAPGPGGGAAGVGAPAAERPAAAPAAVRAIASTWSSGATPAAVDSAAWQAEPPARRGLGPDGAAPLAWAAAAKNVLAAIGAAAIAMQALRLVR